MGYLSNKEIKKLKFKKIGKNISTAKKFYSEQKDEQIILKEKTNLITCDSRKKIIKKSSKRIVTSNNPFKVLKNLNLN